MLNTDESLMHKKRRAKRKCRNVCTLRIPILGICLSRKRKCSKKRRK